MSREDDLRAAARAEHESTGLTRNQAAQQAEALREEVSAGNPGQGPE